MELPDSPTPMRGPEALVASRRAVTVHRPGASASERRDAADPSHLDGVTKGVVRDVLNSRQGG
jgi:hypothetical protein